MSSRLGPTRTSRNRRSPPGGDRPGRLRRLALGALYLSALSLLIVWEYRDRLEALSSECELRDQVKSSLYNRPYEKLLDWAASDVVGHVVTLAIPAELEEVQKNLCLGRDYLADVLRTLATQHPAVVVIDKFYSASTCASQPASTQSLVEAVRSLKVPVVIGESTDGLESRVASACLVRKPQMEFNASNVRHGLTRLNSELERFPLRWLVLSAAKADGPGEPGAREAGAEDAPKVEFADSLSLAAVKAYDPAFAAQRSIRQLILHDDHAYANLAIEIPHMTTTQLLCAAGDAGTRQKWSVTCGGEGALPNMMGRVVLVGSENALDEKIVLQKHMWGFELQARYIETLLSGDYLRYLPLSLGFVIFALFIFLIEGLPTILHARRPRWKKIVLIGHAYPQRRYLWVIFWTVAVIVVSAFVSLALRYLPPLLVYGDILLVAVTRLLFFMVESAEHPFLHAHTHGKVHPMSTLHAESTTAGSSAIKAPAHEAHVPPSAPQPFEPTGPVAPAPVPLPTSGNNPGSEGGLEG
jgi:CHASE2 domain-containing sensor protein